MKSIGSKKESKSAQKPVEKSEKMAKTPIVPSVRKSIEVATTEPEPVVDHFNTEQIVGAIHKQKEEVQRITVDVPKDIYQQMKVHLAHQNVSIRDFVVRLIDVYLVKNNV